MRVPGWWNNRGLWQFHGNRQILLPKMRPWCHQHTPLSNEYGAGIMVVLSNSQRTFRRIFCRGSWCRRQFFICSPCYRNHRYCSIECRKLADIENRAAARRRYRESPEGKANGRDIQRRYRLRKAALARAEAQKTVMDNTTNPQTTSGIIASPSVSASSEAQKRPFLSESGQIVCHICGRTGHIIQSIY